MTTAKGHFANALSVGSENKKHCLGFEELCEIVAPIAKKRGVDKIYPFGSRARGENDVESDYDLYIILGRINSLIGLSGLSQDLEEALGNNVDIISEGPYIKEGLPRVVLRDRRLVYEA